MWTKFRMLNQNFAKGEGEATLIFTFHDLPPSSMTAKMEKKEFALHRWMDWSFLKYMYM